MSFWLLRLFWVVGPCSASPATFDDALVDMSLSTAPPMAACGLHSKSMTIDLLIVYLYNSASMMRALPSGSSMRPCGAMGPVPER